MRSSHLIVICLLLPLACQRGPEGVRRNVVLITIDTLRWDRLGCTGYAEAETPNLDALAAGGTLYPAGVAPTPLTLPSHSTMLSGRLPLEHGARANSPFRFPEDLDTVATTFEERGYATWAVVGAEVLAPGCGLERDFDRYDFAVPARPAGSIFLNERPANEVTDRALALLEAHDATQPFFLWTHYFDPHAPYSPPDAFRERFPDDPYDGEVAFVDRQVGRLLDRLDEKGLKDDTVIVLTSDHGEAFGEHGEETHGFFLYDATIRVPVLVWDRRLEHGCVDSNQVRLRDLRGFLEARASDLEFDLTAPSRRGEPALIESLYGAIHCDYAQLRGLRSPDGTKYLEAGAEELYELELDPNEELNRADDDDPVVRARLEAARRALERALSTPRSGPPIFDGDGIPGYLRAPVSEDLLTIATREENGRRPSPAEMREAIARLQEGVRLVEERLYELACQRLEAGVQLDPGNPSLRFWLGRAHYKAANSLGDRGRMDRAILQMKETLRLRPDYRQAGDLLLMALALRGRYREALDRGREAEAGGRAGPKTLEAMGHILRLRQGPLTDDINPWYDEAEAFQYLLRAVESDPARADPKLLNLLLDRYTSTEDRVHAAEVQGWLESIERAGG